MLLLLLLQVWLNALLAMARGSTIWAVATEPDGNGDGGDFKRKLLDTAAWSSDAQREAASFDPSYRLPEGTRATSILDWKARQFDIARKENGLVVKRFVGLVARGPHPPFISLSLMRRYGDGDGEVADWCERAGWWYAHACVRCACRCTSAQSLGT